MSSGTDPCERLLYIKALRVLMERLLFNEMLPCAALSSHIECYWQLVFNQGSCDEPLDCLPPQGTFDLIFTPESVILSQYDGQGYQQHCLTPGCWLIGQQTRSYRWNASAGSQLFGVRFKPFALFESKRIAPVELKNHLVELTWLCELVNCNIEPLLRGLDNSAYSTNMDNGFYHNAILAEQLMLQLFGDSLAKPLVIRPLSNVIMMSRGDILLRDLCRQFELSKVTLRHRFLTNIGLLPKELCKIWRLNYFLLLKQQQPDSSLTDLGIQAGYYDQAHLNKEFKAIFPSNPTQFFAQSTPLLNSSLGQINRRLRGGYAPFSQDLTAT